MSEDVKPLIIKRTQESLGKFIKKPPLTEKLLRKPPFRFLHDIVTAVIQDTGFLEGLYTPEEMVSDNVKDKDSKIAFLQKLIETVKLATGVQLTVRPTKIVSGHDPEKTNELLQAIARALDKKIDSSEAVQRVLKKGKETKGAKKSREDVKKTGKDVASKGKNVGSNKQTTSLSRNEAQERAKKQELVKKTRSKNSMARTGKDDAEKTKAKDSKRRVKEAEALPSPVHRQASSLQEQPLSIDTEIPAEHDATFDIREEIPVEGDVNDMSMLNAASPVPNGDVDVPQSPQEPVVMRPSSTTTHRPPSSKPGSRRHSLGKKTPSETSRTVTPFATKEQNGELEASSLTTQVEGTMSPNNDLKSMNSLTGEDKVALSLGEEKSNIFNLDGEASSSNGPVVLGSSNKEINGEHQESIVPSPSQQTPTPSRPPSVRPPTGLMQRPRTSRSSSARPRSARPAAPRIRDRGEVPLVEAPRPMTGKIVSNVIVEGDKDKEDDEDDNFVVEESQQPLTETQPEIFSAEQQQPQSINEGQQGHLVEQILKTQKELEDGSRQKELEDGTHQKQNLENNQKQPRKVQIEWEAGAGDAARKREREVAQREVDRLRNSIQTLTRAANPLGKLMDFLQEDVDAMQRELEMWSEENSQLQKDLKREQSITEQCIEPMKAHLTELDQAIEDQLDKISAVKSNILRNDEKIHRMLGVMNLGVEL